MKDTVSEWFLNHVPWYIVLPIVLVIGLVKYGPKFVKAWADTLHEMRERDKLPLSGFITDLKIQREKLEAKVQECEDDIEKLRIQKDAELKVKQAEIDLLRQQLRDRE